MTENNSFSWELSQPKPGAWNTEPREGESDDQPTSTVRICQNTKYPSRAYRLTWPNDQINIIFHIFDVFRWSRGLTFKLARINLLISRPPAVGSSREYIGNWNLTLIETGYRTFMYAFSCFHIAAQATQVKTAAIVIAHFLSAVTSIICCMLIIWLWSILSETSILYQY